jgi:NADP-dependent alcohol dehydrogenase
MSVLVRGRYRTTEVRYDLPMLSGWLRERCDRTVTLVVDANLADAPIVTRVRRSVEFAGRRAEVLLRSLPADLSTVAELGERLAGAEAVVAVGGGSLLDEVKLAALLPGDPTLPARLTVRRRGGVVLLPPTVEPALPVATVPTTVGTGSERSGVVCLTCAGMKRLVMGAGLQPELAILDPLATETLPWDLLLEGALEVFFRVTGTYAGDPVDLPTEDALAEALLVRLVQLGNELAVLRAAGSRPDEVRRLELAKISGLSHTLWLSQARDPYACRGWYLANELSTGVGVRKMTAVAALLPQLWAAFAEDPRWGSARRLAQLWRAVRTVDADRFPADPADGVAALIDFWQVNRQVIVDAGQLRQISQAALRTWGDGLPALHGFTDVDLEDLLTRSVAPALAAARST